MLEFAMGRDRLGPKSVLAIGAHPDDVEIGCGGLLLRLTRTSPGVHVHVVVLSGTDERAEEARTAARLFLAGADATVEVLTLADGRFPESWGTVKDALEVLAQRTEAELVLAPHPGDAHQDHRLIAEIVPTVWRDHLILGYEIPKWDGDLSRPNLYVPLDEEVARAKVDLLNRAYTSQAGRDWWDDEVFLGLARLRGMECRARYAEAFHVTRAALAL